MLLQRQARPNYALLAWLEPVWTNCFWITKISFASDAFRCGTKTLRTRDRSGNLDGDPHQRIRQMISVRMLPG